MTSPKNTALIERLPTLKESKKIVDEILEQRRGAYSISTEAEPHQEHINIRGKRLDIFASTLRQIEEKTGFQFHMMYYWNEPDFCDRYPQMPKYMRDYTTGDHIELHFVRQKIRQSKEHYGL